MRAYEPSGHVYRRDGARGPVWYAKHRLPDGRQVKKRIGPAWRGPGRPPAGRFSKRSAEAWLSGVLAEARAGTLPGMVRTDVRFAQACEDYLHWLQNDRQRKTVYASLALARSLASLSAWIGSRTAPDAA